MPLYQKKGPIFNSISSKNHTNLNKYSDFELLRVR